MPKNAGNYPYFGFLGLFWVFRPLRGPRRPADQPCGGCFTSTPHGGALSPSRVREVSEARFSRRGPVRASDQEPPPGAPTPLFQKPRDRAPARGVDVKPPPRDRSDPGKGLSDPLPGSGTSKGPKSPDLTEIRYDLEFSKSFYFQSKCPKMRVITRISGFWAFFGFFDPSGVRDVPPTSRAGVVLHQPLTAGPCPRPTRDPGNPRFP